MINLAFFESQKLKVEPPIGVRLIIYSITFLAVVITFNHLMQITCSRAPTYVVKNAILDERDAIKADFCVKSVPDETPSSSYESLVVYYLR